MQYKERMAPEGVKVFSLAIWLFLTNDYIQYLVNLYTQYIFTLYIYFDIIIFGIEE